MRWTWFRRTTSDNEDQLRARVESAERRLKEAERMAPQVERRVSKVERIASRNSFAPMIRRALGGH